MRKSTLSTLMAGVLVTLGAASAAQAGQEPAVQAPAPTSEKEESIYDKLWKIPVLYSNPDGAFIQEFRFVGRLNLDYYNLNSSLGWDQDWVVRRLRVGAKVKFLRDFLLYGEVDLQPQTPDPLYSRLTEMSLTWAPCEAFHVAVGKLAVGFGLDGATSSNELLTLERSNLSNNLWFTENYMSGVSVSGKAKAWQWQAGIYSGGQTSPEFGNFNAGNFGVMSVGYDFATKLGVKKALLRADYVYNDPNPKSNATRPFEQIGALVFQLDATRWGLSAEVTGGLGYGTQSNAAGFGVMPWVMLTDKLQLVARYNFIASEDPGGIRFNRYDNVLAKGKGDQYQDVYVGLNYYLYGHKLKLQTGWQYVDMRDCQPNGEGYNGWSWLAGLRIYF